MTPTKRYFKACDHFDLIRKQGHAYSIGRMIIWLDKLYEEKGEEERAKADPVNNLFATVGRICRSEYTRLMSIPETLPQA